ncbi:MAG: lipoprotein-releasing system ATP-binding protein LolD [Bacteroidia bacterium]|nr:MAG: lipoprotein-releasing system ATP-binding protein LolD [Bacteroidia bacterium]
MGVTKRPVFVRAETLWKEYVMGSTPLQVLKGAELEIRQGEIIVVIGPSGSGKSTLLHILGGLDKPTRGLVSVGGQNLFTLSEEQRAAFRNRRLGFIFQFHHLLLEFSALENVAMPALIKGESLKEVRFRAERLLQEVGLEERADHKPSELSGGEQQRVAVARALINDPALILADEPSGNLDEENGARLHKLLVDLARKKGLTVVFATHNPDLTKRGDRVLRLVDGKLVPVRH